MKTPTFITGNQRKAEYMSKYLGFPIIHQKVDLDEIQSLDLTKIVDRKVRQAYDIVRGPVIVEDVSLEFTAWGGLPGPFIRFFVDQMGLDQICSALPQNKRGAYARCVIGYFDGSELKLFESGIKGEVAQNPQGEKVYGWDQIFIPEGYQTARASLSEVDDRKTYLQIKPFAQLKAFLESRN